MKIKNIILVLLLLLTTTGCTFAQPMIFQTEPWNATIKVVGEDGQPISDADVSVAYTKPPYAFSDDEEYHGSISGTTDVNGLFSATHTDRTGSLGFSVGKQGYYETRNSCTLKDPTENANDRNISLTLVLKKIVNPIPMYAKRLNTHVPALDKSVGFDLMAGDWVAPYGKGANSDILFTGHFDKHADGESDFTLTASFPNPGDGIQEFTEPDTEIGGFLRSSHEAPAEGYQSQWVQTDNRKLGRPIETNRDPNHNYYFRVRTVLDENGNVKSALYGKIYGDFMEFSYYLNPMPNDRNVEFDPKHNLLGGLKSFEEVKAP